MTSLVNTRTGEELKVLKYAPPKKFTAGTAKINGVEVETRFTSGRGKEYTYFGVNDVSCYVPGKLEDGVDHTITPEEGFKGPAWSVERVSTYKPKRVKKEGAADDSGTNQAQEPQTGEQVAEQSASGEPTSQEGEGATAEAGVAPRQRRKRGE